MFLIIWVHWNRSVDEGCWWKSSSSHDLWVFFLPETNPPYKVGCYHVTSDIYAKLFYHKHSTVDAFLEFHLISFFGENDLCAFFPSRLHIYVQDFVLDTGCVSICIHNLLKKQINVFRWARLPLLFPRVGQSRSSPTLRDILIFFVHPM